MYRDAKTMTKVACARKKSKINLQIVDYKCFKKNNTTEITGIYEVLLMHGTQEAELRILLLAIYHVVYHEL